MSSLLFVFAHPDPNRSRANRAVLDRVRDLSNITISDLYEKYPRFHIRVAEEQALLEAASTIVLQYPMYWYSLPPLLMLWIDDVLTEGFAYGKSGNALRGKNFCLSFTTGGGSEAYSPQGYHERPITDFLPPLMQTARLCGMKWLEPLILHGASRATPEQIDAHARHVRTQLEALT